MPPTHRRFKDLMDLRIFVGLMISKLSELSDLYALSGVWGRPGGVWKVSWGVLGVSRGDQGTSWECLGRSLGDLGATFSVV